ncbi:isochorismatase family protein [Streptomyces niveiscabiei]|uniref:Isochorismatase family protein n=1 Tax=Streptomyces niveiscabiei TaxID=164115 RepID=A0ABW9HVB6_9ACTN|nr:isochorismatase family protein [Streptomyces niveiscabiei]
MGQPSIAPYPMPDASALPLSHVSWSLDPARGALLVHGMQDRFAEAFPAGKSPVVELVENVTALRELAGALGMPVVFSAEDSGGPVLAPLTPRPGEHLLDGARPNAFLRSHLGRLLRDDGRDQLVVCGMYAHQGVLLTAADAAMNGFEPFVVADAVAAFSAEEHTIALRWSARGSVVRTTDALLRDLLLRRGRREA